MVFTAGLVNFDVDLWGWHTKGCGKPMGKPVWIWWCPNGWVFLIDVNCNLPLISFKLFEGRCFSELGLYSEEVEAFRLMVGLIKLPFAKMKNNDKSLDFGHTLFSAKSIYGDECKLLCGSIHPGQWWALLFVSIPLASPPWGRFLGEVGEVDECLDCDSKIFDLFSLKVIQV